MADINHVVLVGRLTRDAELKYTAGGQAVSKFSIAINRRRKSGDQWVDEANFFDIVVWGRQAESLNQYLVKGKQIGIDGELRQDRWEQDGQNRSKVEIVATNIQLLGGGANGGSGGGGYGGGSSGGGYGGNHGEHRNDSYGDSGRSYGGGAPSGGSQGGGYQGGGAPSAGESAGGYADDIPF
jgi:single-strand DNA-binding protein